MGGPGRKSILSITDFLSKKPGHVHFVGISGIGMAGLAFLLKALDFKVSGCDLVPGRMAKWLKERGIRVYPNHDPAHIRRDVEWVVRTAAVSADAPEVIRAKKMGIPVFSRGTVLPEVIAGFKSIAIGGTHGKTTTTTFITQVMMSAGRMPSWCIGGESNCLGGVAGFRGKVSLPNNKHVAEDIIVVEADESDGTLARYRPDIAVVTNIEFDHMEHFSSVRDFENCFRNFINNARQRAVFCIEDPRARALCGKISKCLSYGFRREADVRGTELKPGLKGTAFKVLYRGKKLGRIDLPVPGVHNVLNALAATAAGLETGLSFKQIQRGLSMVSLPRRRFDRVAEKNGITVISDYAHHPSEIAALIRTARRLKHRRLLAVFQPHRYTRTLALGADFPAAFEGVDELVLVPVYAASEKPLKGGTIWDLYGTFRSRTSNHRFKIPGLQVSVATSLEQAWAYFRTQLKPGDLFLVVGAGDVEQIAEWAGKEVPALRQLVPDFERLLRNLGPGTRILLNEPMARRTTLKAGGVADVLVETNSEKGLSALVKRAHNHNLPLTLLGAGSNVLVSDLGIRGITARLSGGVFSRIRQEKRVVMAGAGVPISRLLNWLEEQGLGGLEFLEGIPGTIGGALRMNAGAWGDEIWKHVSWIRCLNMDGSTCKVRGHAVKSGYRECPYLRERILIEAALDVSPANPEGKKKRLTIRHKRHWLKGLHSAGSVFRNPRGGFAGQLIERAGMKGARIGGAVVSRSHANVIVTETGVRASDVMALIEKIRAEVISRFGVHLETEVEFLE